MTTAQTQRARTLARRHAGHAREAIMVTSHLLVVGGIASLVAPRFTAGLVPPQRRQYTWFLRGVLAEMQVNLTLLFPVRAPANGGAGPGRRRRPPGARLEAGCVWEGSVRVRRRRLTRCALARRRAGLGVRGWARTLLGCTPLRQGASANHAHCRVCAVELRMRM